MASKAPTRVPAQSSVGVRRNLFHHHLSRRPTGTSTSTSSIPQQQARVSEEENEIVARDSDGNYVLRIPALPPLDEEQMQDEDMGHERESMDHL